MSQLRLSAVIGVPLETITRWEEQRTEVPPEYESLLEATFEAFDRELLARFQWRAPVETAG